MGKHLFSQESNCAGVSFNKVAVLLKMQASGLQLYQKETPAQVVSAVFFQKTTLSLLNTETYHPVF